MNISVLILGAVFLLIAVRQVGRFRLRIWQIMTGGAVAALVTGAIAVPQAAASVHPDVMLFLFGMFVVGHALEDSGYLSHLSYALFTRARSTDQLVLLIIFGMGLGSAILMNDTLAIIGTPVVLHLAHRHGLSPRLVLLALAFSITTGSVMSPIGNPQNFLIAVEGGMQNPFLAFFIPLALPTLINLLMIYGFLRWMYPAEFHDIPLVHTRDPLSDPALARLSRVSLALLIGGVVLKIMLGLAGWGDGFSPMWIALTAAAPVLLLSPRRLQILRELDWHTLAFFVAMFIVMESVWESGFFQSLLGGNDLDLKSDLVILLLGVVLSQFISNVPLVALYLPILVLLQGDTGNLLALAAGSTIAGNLSILGAASNVIIIQNAERKRGETLGFLEFARAGALLTGVQAGVYWLFLARI